jgi:osmoprotectant transport system permease protein
LSDAAGQRARLRLRWPVLIGLTVGFAVLVTQDAWWEALLRMLFPQLAQVLHPRASLGTLVAQHMTLIVISSALVVLVGLPLGVVVTRSYGRRFLSVTTEITTLGQTFPSIAVLALAVPLTGFGLKPTVLALFLYGLLPVVRNTIAGLLSIPAEVTDAARGLGLTDSQVLRRIELPLAAPIILAGVRTSVIINVGTAMIGAVIGAGGLGSPVVAGIIQDNVAFILEGAIPAAMLALLLDQLLAAAGQLVPGTRATA